jgi:hypothetical protein
LAANSNSSHATVLSYVMYSTNANCS